MRVICSRSSLSGRTANELGDQLSSGILSSIFTRGCSRNTRSVRHLPVHIEPASAVLVRLFEQLSVPGPASSYSYHLFFDPGVKYYMLDISAVAPVRSDTNTSALPANAGFYARCRIQKVMEKHFGAPGATPGRGALTEFRLLLFGKSRSRMVPVRFFSPPTRK
jgi:hypothetical protein